MPFTKVQEAIHKYAEPNYMITLVRRAMMRIAERVAKNRGCGCIINGEDLGQVASQTLESITVTNSVIRDLPVFRPLIGFDKNEIIEISKKIGTYETSIKPYEDCCTVFLPESPATKPTIRRSEANEKQNRKLRGTNRRSRRRCGSCRNLLTAYRRQCAFRAYCKR